jgi:Tfp pilus assembly protein PilV
MEKWVNKKRKSFTLVEALVAVAMFMVVVTILINIYISTIRAERIAYVVLRDSNVTQSVLETISRAVRMGSDFEIIDNDTLRFKTEEEGVKFFTEFKYRYDDLDQRGWIERVKDIDRSGDVVTLTPVEMNIDDFEIQISGKSQEQKSILIKFATVSNVHGNEYRTFVQTSITPRLLISN